MRGLARRGSRPARRRRVGLARRARRRAAPRRRHASASSAGARLRGVARRRARRARGLVARRRRVAASRRRRSRGVARARRVAVVGGRASAALVAASAGSRAGRRSSPRRRAAPRPHSSPRRARASAARRPSSPRRRSRVARRRFVKRRLGLARRRVDVLRRGFARGRRLVRAAGRLRRPRGAFAARPLELGPRAGVIGVERRDLLRRLVGDRRGRFGTRGDDGVRQRLGLMGAGLCAASGLGEREAAIGAVVRGAAEQLAALRALAADAGLAHDHLAAHVVEPVLEFVQLGVDLRVSRVSFVSRRRRCASCSMSWAVRCNS